MKKTITGLLLATVLVLTALLGIACFMVPDYSKKEVTLLGVQSSLVAPNVEANASAQNIVFASTQLSAPLFADTDAGESETPSTGETETPTTDPTEEEPTPRQDDPEFYSDYTIIYKTQTTLYFTIKLSNPRNYYILDFRLSCEQEDIEVKQGSHYSKINDANTYIRWDEATDRIGNHTATFELKLPNADISPDKIKILDMYYSDRTDGTNKTSVNMNNKETYTVYKIDEPVKMSDRKNNFTEFSFKLDKIEGAVVKSVKVDDVEYTADESGVYKIPSGELVVAYEYRINDEVVYEKEIREEIELLRFVKDKTSTFYFEAAGIITVGGMFYGTDVGETITVRLAEGVEYILVKEDNPVNYVRKTLRNDDLPEKLYSGIVIVAGSEIAIYQDHIGD